MWAALEDTDNKPVIERRVATCSQERPRRQAHAARGEHMIRIDEIDEEELGLIHSRVAVSLILAGIKPGSPSSTRRSTPASDRRSWRSRPIGLPSAKPTRIVKRNVQSFMLSNDRATVGLPWDGAPSRAPRAIKRAG